MFPIEWLLHLTNIGTLFAFVIVCAAVLIMRKTNPQADRPFRCPMSPLVPLLGIGSCLILMFSLPPENWYRLLGWLAIGLVIYFLYGRRYSAIGRELRREIASHGVSPAGMLRSAPKDTRDH
jgi:APA family basic amino acid/polyamine antiporter